MTAVSLAVAAERELDEAIEWYRKQQEGLQERFLLEFLSTVRRIQAQPEIYTELRPGIRRGLLRRFPFSVIYEITGDAILVLAVAHQHRKPFYGRDA